MEHSGDCRFTSDGRYLLLGGLHGQAYAVETWKLDTNVEGAAMQQIKAAKPGQYRLSYKLQANVPGTAVPGLSKDSPKSPGTVVPGNGDTIEGGYLFLVMGEGFDSTGFRFNDIELLTDKKEYNPGDNVKLAINVNKNNGTVLLFTRPTNGVYLAPKVLRLKGKSIEEEIAVVQRDMPNFFIEAMTLW